MFMLKRRISHFSCIGQQQPSRIRKIQKRYCVINIVNHQIWSHKPLIYKAALWMKVTPSSLSASDNEDLTGKELRGLMMTSDNLTNMMQRLAFLYCQISIGPHQHPISPFQNQSNIYQHTVDIMSLETEKQTDLCIKKLITPKTSLVAFNSEVLIFPPFIGFLMCEKLFSNVLRTLVVIFHRF